MVKLQGCFGSIPFDFFIRITGMSNLRFSTIIGLPLISDNDDITIRVLMLNALTDNYAELWNKSWKESFKFVSWSKEDERLEPDVFSDMTEQWRRYDRVRNDFVRRYMMIELDVLVSMAIGITLEQLKTLYRIQFPVSKSYEEETWYDIKGRIVFTTNRSLNDIGVDRKTWENVGAVQPAHCGDVPWDGVMKHAPAGYVFARTIMDDTMPGGPVERTIEYVAPFDRCDREQDYETAWKYFEEKYGDTQ